MATIIKNGTNGTNGTSGTTPTNGTNGTDGLFTQNGKIGADSIAVQAIGGNGGTGGNGTAVPGANGGDAGNATITFNGNIFNAPAGPTLLVSLTADGGNGGAGGTLATPGTAGKGGNASVTINGNIVQPNKVLTSIEFDAFSVGGTGSTFGNATSTINGNIFQTSKATGSVTLDANAAGSGTNAATINGNIIQGNINNVSLYADAAPTGTATVNGNIIQTGATNTGTVLLETTGNHIAITGNKIQLGLQAFDLTLNPYSPYDTTITGNTFTGTGSNAFVFTDNAHPGPHADTVVINMANNTLVFDGQASNNFTGFSSITVTGSGVTASITGGAGNDVLNGTGGNDTLTGGGGNDTLNGDAGSDTAVFSGNSIQYTIAVGTTGNGTVTDTVPGRDGTDTLTSIEFIQFADGTLNTATGIFTPTTGNHAPVANPDAYSTAQGNALSVNAAGGVLHNDTDADNDTLTASLVTGPTHATNFSFNSDGSFSYTPTGVFSGTDSFTYQASDGHGGTSTATATITVGAVANHAPVANPDAYSTTQGNALSVNAAGGVLHNDTDADNDTLTASLVTGPAHATNFSFNSDGSFSYTPAGNFSGNDSFTYQANDGHGGTSTATATITIAPTANHAPVANPDAYSTTQGGALTLNAANGVLHNDTDADNDTLTASLVTGPTHATSFTFNSDGSFSYTPVGTYSGNDTFTYQANDGHGGTSTATATITIAAVNHAPVANPDAYSTNQNVALTENAANGVLHNDTDADNDTLTASLVTGPAHAISFTFNSDGSFSYTPLGTFSGTDSFTYQANDGHGGTSTSTATITIAAVNHAPVANADAYSTNEDSALTVTAANGVLHNDTDPDNDTLTASVVTGPANASSFTLNADGSFSYVPTTNFNGTDSFTYAANDGHGGITNAVATITVNSVNDAPVVDLNGAAAGTGVTLAYTEGNPATTIAPVGTVTDVDSPDFNGGSLTVSFAANGTTADQLTIQNQGVAAGQVGVNGNTVTYGGATIGSFAGGTNGSDLVISFTSPLVTPAAAQAVEQAIQYANTSQNPSILPRSVSFTFNDGDGTAIGGVATGSATATINVTAVDNAPVVTASAGTTAAFEQVPVAIDPGLNITDVDSANLTGATVTITGGLQSLEDVLGFTNQNNITGTYNAGTGTLTLTGSDSVANYKTALESVTYDDISDTPNTANRTISFVTNDGTLNSNAATKTVSVTPVNDAPVVDLNGAAAGTGVTLAYTEGNPATTIAPVGTVTDVDSPDFNGGSLTVSFTANGTATDQLTIQNQGFGAGQIGVIGNVLAYGGLPIGTFTGGTNGSNLVISFTSASATPAAAQAVEQAIQYANTSQNPSILPRSVSFTFNDGDGTANGGVATGSATATINVTAVDNAPVVTASAGTTAAFEQVPVAIDPGLNITDVDSANLTGATVTITGGLQSLEDVLGFTNQNNITGTYNAGTGTLTLTGSDSVANYKTALDSVTYDDISDTPNTANRTISFVANDGTLNSNTATKTLSVTPVNDAPVVDLNGAPAGTGVTLAYTANNPATTIAPVGTVTDVDSADFNGGSLTVSFTANGTATDQLTIQNQGLGAGQVGVVGPAVTYGGLPIGTVTGGTNGSNLVISFTSPLVTPAVAQAVEKAIQYSNSSAMPSTLPRSVSFTFNDGDGTANGGIATGSATATINVTGLNHPPVAINDSYVTAAGQALAVGPAGGLLANDTDVDNNTLSIGSISSPAHGSLSINSSGAFTYTPNAGFSGTDTFTYQATDGQAPSNTATVTIKVDNAPVAVNDTYATGLNTPLTVNAAGGVQANDSDADGDTLTSSVVIPSANGGALALNADGSFTYTPANNFTGTDTFTYKDNDGALNSNNATISFNVGATSSITGPGTLTGTANDDIFILDPMTSAIDGLGNTPTGGDTVVFSNASSGVTATTDVGMVPQDFFASGLGMTQLTNIENLTGSDFDDVLSGTDGVRNTLLGGAGNDVLLATSGDGINGDTLDGGAGNNTVDFSGSSSGISVDLSLGAQNVGGSIGDITLTNIQNAVGSSNSDVLQGNSGDNNLDGGSGGNDTLSYANATADGLVVNLALGTASGGGVGNDTLANFQTVVGSNFADTLIGDSNDNTLVGGDGNDIIFGHGGTNQILGGDGTDVAYYEGLETAYTDFTLAAPPTLASVVGGPENVSDSLSFVERLKFLSPSHVMDVDNNGKGDLIIQNNTTGNLTIQTQPAGTITVTNVNGPANVNGVFRAVGTGQFNPDADRAADVLLQDTNTGNLEVITDLGGANTVTQFTIQPGASAWKAITVGDFNGDAASDVLLQNQLTGAAQIMFVDKGANISSMVTMPEAVGTVDGISAIATPGANWKVIAAGDFNGDGKSDILWQNSATKQVEVYEMNGASVINTPAAQAASGLTAIGTGDFNNDGNSDILFQNASGQAVIWTMNGDSHVGTQTIAKPSTASGWSVSGAEDIDGNGYSDVIWTNAVTGVVAATKLSTLAPVVVPMLTSFNTGSQHLVASTGGG